MKTGSVSNTQMRDAYFPPNTKTYEETKRDFEKRSAPTKALASKYLKCFDSLDEKDIENNFNILKYALSKTDFNIVDLMTSILDLRYIQECVVSLPTHEGKSHNNQKAYLDLNSGTNELYLMHKQKNVQIWQHFIEVLLPFISKEKSISSQVQEHLRCQMLMHMFDNLIYSTSPLHSRCLQENLTCFPIETYVWEIAKKFKLFILYGETVQDGLLTCIAQSIPSNDRKKPNPQGLTGEKSKLAALRILDILETYLCMTTYNMFELEVVISTRAQEFINNLIKHNFKKSSIYKLHKLRYDQLLKDIPLKLKENPIELIQTVAQIKADEQDLTSLLANLSLDAQSDENSTIKVLAEVETQHQVYTQAKVTQNHNEANDAHQEMLTTLLEEQAARHAKDIEELEKSLTLQKEALENELKQQRTHTLEQLQAKHEQSIASRKKNAQDALTKRKEEAKTQLEREIKALNTSHANRCDTIKKEHEKETETIASDSQKEIAKQKTVNQKKLSTVKATYAQTESSLKQIQQQEIEKLQQENTAEMQTLESNLQTKLESLRKAHLENKSSLKRENENKNKDLRTSFQEKEAQLKKVYMEELDGLDKAQAQTLAQAETNFKQQIAELDKEHQENKSRRFEEHQLNIVRIQEEYERSIQFHVNQLAQKPYKEYLGSLAQLFKLDSPTDVFKFLYDNNKLHLAIPTIPANYKMYMQSNPILYNFWLSKLAVYPNMSPQHIIGLFLLLPIIIINAEYLNDNASCKHCIDDFIGYFETDITANDMNALTKSLQSVLVNQTGLFAEYKIFQFDELNRYAYVANHYPTNAVYLPTYVYQGNRNNNEPEAKIILNKKNRF